MEKVVFYAWKDSLVDNQDKPTEPVEAKIELPTSFRDKEDVKGFMGWDGFLLADPDLNIASLSLQYLRSIQSEASCGQCFPCRVGTTVMAQIIEGITKGQGKAGD